MQPKYPEIDSGQIFAAICRCIVNFTDAEGEIVTLKPPSGYKSLDTLQSFCFNPEIFMRLRGVLHNFLRS